MPDETCTWVEGGRELRAEIWRDLVLNKTTPSDDNRTFDVYAVYDPDFETPWLLAIPLNPRQLRRFAAKKCSFCQVQTCQKFIWPNEAINF